MAVTFAPFETYADVTGVVDATAAAEVAALIVVFRNRLHLGGVGETEEGVEAPSPDFDYLPYELSLKLHAELTALAAAVAAAPTS